MSTYFKDYPQLFSKISKWIDNLPNLAAEADVLRSSPLRGINVLSRRMA